MTPVFDTNNKQITITLTDAEVALISNSQNYTDYFSGAWNVFVSRMTDEVGGILIAAFQADPTILTAIMNNQRTEPPIPAPVEKLNG